MKERGSILRESKWEYIPFFLIAFIIPLTVLRIPLVLHEEISRFIKPLKHYEDFFHLIKVFILYGATLLLFLMYLIKWEGPLPSIFFVFVPYIVLVVLSVCFSDNKVTAVFGVFDHYEGGLTQICYVLILIFAYCFSRDEKRIFILVKIILWASVAVALVGMLQFAGADFINHTVPGNLLNFGTDGSYEDAPGISSTIGNSNYTGTYAALLIPLSIAAILLEKNFRQRILAMMLLFGASVFLLFGSLSRAGYISFFMMCPLIVIFLRKNIQKQYKWVIAGVAYAILIFTMMNIASSGVLLQEIKSINPFANKMGTDDKLIFYQIGLNKDSVAIETNKWALSIQYRENGFYFEDVAGNPIPADFDENNQSFHLTEKPYDHVQARIQQKEGIQWMFLQMEKKEIELVYTGQEMLIVGFNRLLTEISPVETFPLIKNESFASGRGYIWSRAVPLLKKTIAWGYGPDTFLFVFPQNDITGKLNYGSIWAVISKPHNWYLQVALGSGVLSLFCLLLFFAWFGFTTVKATWSANVNDEKAVLSSCILLSVVSFLITGMFNDSVVSVSPILWMLSGFSIRLLKMMRDSKPMAESVAIPELNQAR